MTASATSRVAQPVEPTPGLVERFLAPDDSPLVSYRAFRHLTASTRSDKLQASIDVLTTFDADSGFHFEITSEEGSGTIRNKVLLPALEAEAKAARHADADRTALTRANYEFLGVTGDDGNLKRVGIRPRRKHTMLINGAVFLAGDTADLVRIEGEPSERPSFWTRHVKIVREYARVGGVRVPVSMRSTADVLMVGASVFSMTYRYTEINGSPVQ
ncbi:MAG TPA: hypothetical protein VHZ73_08095 [Vicinamibacterales bacterium]|nr:hypothetical protein [Vicinamibacterales bacterium]